ncbi:radical SAM protein with 4Fe4S-binding SPASM domain [Paenibacillus forsythiae]|uniref:Radical SAM protein with 4Fe4S-binding SPASM domain n=1 Tax=Paenibacillus forsythiae TaxID=365616 RepID=A0ABU3H6K8_9BACL|nr:radical SAM protein [Paenibacillus forsythiae]MDT3426458.1 radical SAM protein with 4Fe4S-binding SPASM domain [Paenibacillus forsythiae]
MLQVLNIELTKQCNLDCRHCGVNGCSRSNTNGKDVLALPLLRTILADAHRLGCRHVIYAGGEPFLRNDIYEILDCTEKLGISFSILSNGVLIDEKVAERLSRYQKLSYIRLSLDYADEEKMDNFRGLANISKRIEETIQLLDLYRIRTGIGMSIMPDNIGEIFSVAQKANDWGASFFRAVPVMPIGLAQSMDITDSIYTRALAEMLKAAASYQPHYFGTHFLPKDLKDLSGFMTVPCPGGDHILAISCEGDVSFCPLSASQSTANLFNDTLEQAFQRTKEAKFCIQSMILGEHSSCIGCEESQTCRGGCMAERLSRDIDFTDPQPVCIKQVWENTMSSVETSRDLFRTVNNIVNSYSTSRQMQTNMCTRSLPIWWFPLKGAQQPAASSGRG